MSAPGALAPSIPATGDVPAGASALAVAIAFRPPGRPASIAAAASAVAREAEVVRASLARGSVCGALDIQGTARGTVDGPGACGVDDAVEVRSVAGVRLSTPTIVTCATAVALRNWVVNSAVPRIGTTGGGLERLDVMGGYSCRNRNGAASGRLSEHAFGRAIDVGGFRMRDGTTISVLTGWSGAQGEMLRGMHRAACGIFGTVLGPAANAAHRNHFHFDTLRARGGTYCR